MTIRLTVWIAVLFAVLSNGCAQTAPTENGVAGKWVVSDVACTDCGARRPTEKGAVIEFGAAKVVNPTGDNCDAGPDYSRVRSVAARDILNGAGKRWPEALRKELARHTAVRYGYITCGGFNYMQLLLLPGNQAFSFSEGGIVFVLRKAKPSGAM